MVPVPAGSTTGDRIWVLVASIGSAPTITGPAGWVKVAEYAPGSQLKSALYYRDPGVGEPASYTWTWSASGRNLGFAATYSGLDLGADPLYGVDSGIPGAGPFNTPGVGIVEGDWLWSAAAGRENPGTDDAKTWSTNVGGDAERHDVYSTNTGTTAKLTGGLWDSGTALPGGTGTRALTVSKDLAQVHVWSLRLAGPDPNPPPPGPNPWSSFGMPIV